MFMLNVGVRKLLFGILACKQNIIRFDLTSHLIEQYPWHTISTSEIASKLSTWTSTPTGTAGPKRIRSSLESCMEPKIYSNVSIFLKRSSRQYSVLRCRPGSLFRTAWIICVYLEVVTPFYNNPFASVTSALFHPNPHKADGCRFLENGIEPTDLVCWS